jgi:hypothetical protein
MEVPMPEPVSHPSGALRGLQVALEHNSLRLIDIAATVPGSDGRSLRHTGRIGVELAGIISDLADRLEQDGEGR